MSTVEALRIATSLLSLADRSVKAASRVSDMIDRADAEGRDLNDSEVAELKAMRDKAVQRWDEAGK